MRTPQGFNAMNRIAERTCVPAVRHVSDTTEMNNEVEAGPKIIK